MKLKKPEKMTHYYFFKERGIPFNIVAAHIEITPNRLYQILNGATTCPPRIKKLLDNLVRQIRIGEGTHV